jgi:molybdopterin converting factor small subunit
VITIKVEYLFQIYEITRKRNEEVTLDEPSLRGLLNKLAERYGPALGNRFLDPATGELRKQGEIQQRNYWTPYEAHPRVNSVRPLSVLINGKRDEFFAHGLDAEIKEGDVVVLS